MVKQGMCLQLHLPADFRVLVHMEGVKVSTYFLRDCYLLCSQNTIKMGV